MGQAYIVIFESTKRSTAIREYLRSFNGWGKITDNSFVVMSDKTATQIRDEILKLKDEGDRVFVIKSGVVAAWSNAAARNDWLKKNL